MRPSLIADDLVGDARRVTIMPPGNSMDSMIAPVEALVTGSDEYTMMDGTPVKLISVRCILEGDDLAQLTAGKAVWITFFEQIPPFSVRVDQ